MARRPRLTYRTLLRGIRPAFALRWARGDLTDPARQAVRVAARPPRGPSCDLTAWRVRGTRLEWRGLRPACVGEYALVITHLDAGSGGPRTACERLTGAPRGGCTPSERLGVLTVAVY